MVFTGTFEHAIDAKQRVAIPSKVRAQVQRTLGLADGDPMVWVVTLGDDGCLALYTADGFNDLAEALRASDLESRVALALAMEERTRGQSAKITSAAASNRMSISHHGVLSGVFSRFSSSVRMRVAGKGI